MVLWVLWKGVLAIGARPAAAMAIVTRACNSHHPSDVLPRSPSVGCMHLALSRLICKSCFFEHLFSQKLGVLHTSGFYVLQVLFLSYDPGRP